MAEYIGPTTYDDGLTAYDAGGSAGTGDYDDTGTTYDDPLSLYDGGQYVPPTPSTAVAEDTGGYPLPVTTLPRPRRHGWTINAVTHSVGHVHGVTGRPSLRRLREDDETLLLIGVIP